MIDTADRWWLTLAFPNTPCDECGARTVEHQVVLFRARDKAKLCVECAIWEGVRARPSRRLLAFIEEHPQFENNLEILRLTFSDPPPPELQLPDPEPAVRGPRNPLIGGERARKAYPEQVAAR